MLGLISNWGGIRGSNPCMPEPQSGVLTASPILPFQVTNLYYHKLVINASYFFFALSSPNITLSKYSFGLIPIATKNEIHSNNNLAIYSTSS